MNKKEMEELQEIFSNFAFLHNEAAAYIKQRQVGHMEMKVIEGFIQFAQERHDYEGASERGRKMFE